MTEPLKITDCPTAEVVELSVIETASWTPTNAWALVRSGANEVRTWIAAIAAGNLPMETLIYEPVREWITGMAIAASR